MKKSLIATLVAAPLLTLSSLSFAAEPVLLNAVEMDGVTAGFFDTASVGQINVSPVTVAQANVLTVGSENEADVVSGNFAAIFQ